MNKENIGNKVPTSSDFTPAALNKALFRNSLNHWTVRYIPSLIAGGILFGILFKFTYPLFLLMLAMAGLGMISFVINYYFRGDHFKKRHTLELMKRLEKKTEEKLTDLKQNLIKFHNEHGAEQLEQFKQKFEVLTDILKSKFDSTQLTFNRYYSIAQEVYLSGIDNLNDVIIALKTLESIDLDYINGRLKALNREDKNNMAIKKETEALNRSLQSHAVQKDKINALMAQNESALTQLDEATIAISEINRSENKEAGIDMENSMKALAELAQRTKLYSR